MGEEKLVRPVGVEGGDLLKSRLFLIEYEVIRADCFSRLHERVNPAFWRGSLLASSSGDRIYAPTTHLIPVGKGYETELTFRNLRDVFQRDAGILLNFLQVIIVALPAFNIYALCGDLWTLTTMYIALRVWENAQFYSQHPRTWKANQQENLLLKLVGELEAQFRWGDYGPPA